MEVVDAYTTTNTTRITSLASGRTVSTSSVVVDVSRKFNQSRTRQSHSRPAGRPKQNNNAFTIATGHDSDTTVPVTRKNDTVRLSAVADCAVTKVGGSLERRKIDRGNNTITRGEQRYISHSKARITANRTVVPTNKNHQTWKWRRRGMKRRAA
jgi:hypothetical protein